MFVCQRLLSIYTLRLNQGLNCGLTICLGVFEGSLMI
jgi:hypothetical protein